MCCQYYFSDETYREVRERVQFVDSSFQRAKRNQDIRPMDFSPVVIVRNGRTVLCGQHFGFRNKKTGSLVLNARVETVRKKLPVAGSVGGTGRKKRILFSGRAVGRSIWLAFMILTVSRKAL